MKIIKLGANCLASTETINRVIDLLAERGKGHIVVVSALKGVTDTLMKNIPAVLDSDEAIAPVINTLRETHQTLARHLMGKTDECEQFLKDFETALHHIERLYYGVHVTKDISAAARDNLSSFGERFAVELLVDALQARKIRTRALSPEKIGLVTDGKFGEASANLLQTTHNFRKSVRSLIDPGRILMLPGSFGVSEEDEITCFGRGGDDYAAAVMAVATQAEALEIWTETAGFTSADPELVPEAHLIPTLSYEEAAELAYFDQRHFHPRLLDPVSKKGVNIVIRNIHQLDAPSTEITLRGSTATAPIKSVVVNATCGVLKMSAPDMGDRTGILGKMTMQLAKNGITIHAITSSHTSLGLLVAKQDVEVGYQALKALHPHPYQRLEQLEDRALIAIIGDGLADQHVAACCFAAVAQCGAPVELLTFGPSPVALSLLVRSQDAKTVVKELHHECITPQG